ncbi:RDD family protein [Chitinophaga agri]|uniref:RDD family protein n=1 Tax=Chitinophaga agri TaxID=2703787 RepID=A0A6B9ZN28_9BACT|nr:RDD family protein [Chitinophaga agri]QHS62505.1 RDD family protein [Chitinophaga agri]
MQNQFGDNTQSKGLLDDLHDIPTYTRKASKSDRFVNYFIDSLACNGISGMFMFSMVVTKMSSDAGDVDAAFSGMGFSWLIYYGISVVYYTLFEFGNGGRTLGKLVTRTHAVREDVSPLTLQDAFLRSLCRLIPFEVFSGFGDRPWHDTITKTIVIKK